MANFISSLRAAWHQHNSLVCVGLDPIGERLPADLPTGEGRYFEFCRAIVDATAASACAFKPQFAHFAAVGAEDELQELIAYIRAAHPDVPVILDAKRGDIGSTARMYAIEAFERYNAHAVTVNPYLGYESVAPFLEHRDRGVVLLCRTSNAGSDWLQNAPGDVEPGYLRVARAAAEWDEHKQLMLVTGGTYPKEIARVRHEVADMPLLIPGAGAQGADIGSVLASGLDSQGVGVVVSASRSILYAHEGSGDCEAYALAASCAAEALRDQINQIRGGLAG